MVEESVAQIFGQRVPVASSAAWSDPAIELLVLYNLHYFDDLCARDAASRRAWHRTLLQRWVAENPPPRAPGWDPYPTSRRIVNVIRWLLYGAESWPELMASLAAQVRHLSRTIEVHLGANHVLVNAKALVFAGCYFGNDEGWLDQGRRLFDAELEEQVLVDGGHYERSPMYHALILEDVLDVIALYDACGQAAPARWREHAARMLAWLQYMTHPDGEIAFFNDAALGIGASPAELHAYAARLGIMPVSSATHASGYVRLESERAVLLADFAPLGPDYQPGHGHADSLSFELSVDKNRLLVNSGTDRYGVSAERLRQRSTAAHNTIVVDGLSSSEVWSGFRVGRRARISQLVVKPHQASGAHNGYHHLPGAPAHWRRFTLTRTSLTIEDHVRGAGHHHVELRFHLHPSVSAHQVDRRMFVLERADGLQSEVAIDPRLEAHLEDSTYHPQFGKALPARVIAASTTASLPLEISTTVDWK